jgi:hypothetical protein
MPGFRVIDGQEEILSFKGHEVAVIVNADKAVFTSPVVAISFTETWQLAKLQDGSEVYFHWKDYSDSIPFRDDVVVEKYEAAIAAEKALIAAKQSYRDAMSALGAIQKERGNYEDYQTWLEIPGIPDKKWADE